MINKIFKNKNKNMNEKGPKVIYSNWLLKDEINKWVKYMNIGTINEILMDIGFKSEDCVYLDGIDINKIYYSVNNEELNKNNVITLSYGQFLESSPKIVISDGNKKRTYGYEYISDDRDRIILESYEYMLDNKMKCKKEFDINGNKILYIISNNNYELLLNIEYDDNYEYNSSLNRELKLEEYFGSLELPFDIDSMYKKICEIISLDVDKCRKFELRVNEIDIYNHKSIRDIISLVNGNLVQFGMTKNGRKIFMNDKGSYSYKLVSENEENLKFNFSLDIFDDMVSYSVSNNDRNVIDDDMKKLVNDTIDCAIDDIEDSKKKVRKIFSGRWNG